MPKVIRYSIVRVVVLATILVGILAIPAYAYIDPGTGSYILQMALAFLLGALFALKMFWQNVKAFFVRVFSRRSDSNDDVQ